MSSILRIDKTALVIPEIVEQIYNDMSRDYYVSTDWSIEFYVLQALRGFIAVALKYSEGTEVLLPQIQKSYCVFDWEALEGHRRLKKVINEKLSNFEIRINYEPDRILEKLGEYHSDKSWVSNHYVELLKQLFQGGTLLVGDDNILFHLCSVGLHSHEGQLVAGEIGYIIGSTFTSLTGFCDRDSRISFGKVQILALGKLLSECGFKFLNLGQPPQDGRMQYKADLGGIEIDRSEFIARWKRDIKITPDQVNSFLSAKVSLRDLFS